MNDIMRWDCPRCGVMNVRCKCGDDDKAEADRDAMKPVVEAAVARHLYRQGKHESYRSGSKYKLEGEDYDDDLWDAVHAYLDRKGGK